MSRLTADTKPKVVHGLGALRVHGAQYPGEPIPGFSLDDSEVIFGDAIERVVTWKGGSNVSPLAGKPVRLRFVISDADLYSIQFRP